MGTMMRDFNMTEEQAWAMPLQRAFAYAAFNALHNSVNRVEIDGDGYFAQEAYGVN